MTIPHWEDDHETWDRLELGAWVMPGVWTVDFSLRREMDVKKAVSTDGARLKDKGYAPPQLTLVGKLSTRDEWVELQKIMPSIHPRRPGASRDPFRIAHPKTLLANIQNVFIHEIDAVELDNGVLRIELRAYEWTKEPKPVQKGTGFPGMFTMTGVTFVSQSLEPPDAIARFPGLRGVRVNDSDVNNATAEFYTGAPI